MCAGSQHLRGWSRGVKSQPAWAARGDPISEAKQKVPPREARHKHQGLSSVIQLLSGIHRTRDSPPPPQVGGVGDLVFVVVYKKEKGARDMFGRGLVW